MNSVGLQELAPCDGVSEQLLVIPRSAHPETIGWLVIHDLVESQLRAATVDNEFEELVEPLMQVRQKLSSAEELYPEIIDLELEKLLSNTALGSCVKSEDDHRYLWFQAITEEFDDEQLIEFLEWNIDFTAEAQFELNQKLPGIVARFIGRIEQGISDGWIPSTARKQLERLNDIDFFAGDIFMTEGQNMDGFYEPGNAEQDTRIVVSAQHVFNDEKLEAILTHEMLHAVSGTKQTKHGLRYRGMTDWLDEAVTEHITQVLLGHTTVNAVGRGKGRNYIEERELLAEIGQTKDIIDLYFSENEALMKSLAEQIRKLFGAESYKQLIRTYNTSAKLRAQVMHDLTKAVKMLHEDQRTSSSNHASPTP